MTSEWHRKMTFRDRRDAAIRLAEKLQEGFDTDFSKQRPIVLAIPRGGVITGDEIATRLGADLDVIISKKIGAPDNPELAVGAVMHDGTFFPNVDIIDTLGIRQSYIDQRISEKMKEIERRLERFRGNKEYNLEDRIGILVDDGIATGATVFAAINWLKTQNLKKLIVAMPVGPADTIKKLRQVVSNVVVLYSPIVFTSVGAFYEDFSQVSDEEVVHIMTKYRD